MALLLTAAALSQHEFRPRCHATPAEHFASCAESHCCQDPRGFGCFRRPDRPGIAQCLPLSHQTVNGSCVDSDQWLCPETWLQPPPPPLPPSPTPSTPPPSLPPMPPEVEPYHRCHGNPTEHYGSCMESRCCQDPKFYGCFHKRHKAFAQCLPLQSQIPEGGIRCVDGPEWLCPSTWLQEPPPPPPAPAPPPPFHARCAVDASPSPHFGSCLESHCCADPRMFGCFHKKGKVFAQCMPLAHMLQPDGSCVDSDEWLCPATWLEPPPPPAAPSPPPVVEGCVGDTPSAEYASCLETRARTASALECAPRENGIVPLRVLPADLLTPRTAPLCLARLPRPLSPTGCCANPERFGCFKREDRQWAECLPFARMPTDAATGACVGSAGWLCPDQWLTPSPPMLPPPPPSPPKAPSQVVLALVRSESTVVSQRVYMILGLVTFGLVLGGFSYVLCFRKAVAPHLTSVVDEDAIEIGKADFPSANGRAANDM